MLFNEASCPAGYILWRLAAELRPIFINAPEGSQQDRTGVENALYITVLLVPSHSHRDHAADVCAHHTSLLLLKYKLYSSATKMPSKPYKVAFALVISILLCRHVVVSKYLGWATSPTAGFGIYLNDQFSPPPPGGPTENELNFILQQLTYGEF